MKEAIFKLLQQRCGLSKTQSAEYLGCTQAEVNDWLSNDKQAPEKAMRKLGSLLEMIEAETDKCAMLLSRDSNVAKKRVFMFADDEWAQKYGWPTASAYGMVVANLYSAFEGNIDIYYGQTPPVFRMQDGSVVSIDYLQSLIDKDGPTQ